MTLTPQEQAELEELKTFKHKAMGVMALLVTMGLAGGAMYVGSKFFVGPADQGSGRQGADKKGERRKKALFPQKRVIQLPPSGNVLIHKKELYMNEISDIAANKDGVNLVLFQISAPKGHVRARDSMKKLPEQGQLSLRDFKCSSSIKELIKKYPSLVDSVEGVKILEFEEVFLDPELHGLGIGANMYLSSMKTFWDVNGGKPFIAIPNACRTGSTSPMASAVWEKMAKNYPSVGKCLAILQRPTA